MRAMFETEGISLKDAKYLVHFSPAWCDARDRDDALQEELVRTLDQST
jgi:hypothetical protein